MKTLELENLELSELRVEEIKLINGGRADGRMQNCAEFYQDFIVGFFVGLFDL